jgi:hypothetical protein
VEAEQRYWKARSDIKKALLLLRLVGPEQLITVAEAVAEADRALRTLWFDREPADRRPNSAEMLEVVAGGRRAFDEFTDVARRVTAPI